MDCTVKYDRHIVMEQGLSSSQCYTHGGSDYTPVCPVRLCRVMSFLSQLSAAAMIIAADFPRPNNRTGELMTAEEFLCIVGYQSEQGGGKRPKYMSGAGGDTAADVSD